MTVGRKPAGKYHLLSAETHVNLVKVSGRGDTRKYICLVQHAPVPKKGSMLSSAFRWYLQTFNKNRSDVSASVCKRRGRLAWFNNDDFVDDTCTDLWLKTYLLRWDGCP